MEDTRERIVSAAAELLAAGGREAVTTRAVGTAAGVQAPTIYRLFGDKRGLLDAVAEWGFATYLSGKDFWVANRDPVENLRAGMDLHVEFGLTHPDLYALMYGEPRPTPSPAATHARSILAGHIRAIAAAGRLRVSEAHAVHVIHATGCGSVFALLEQPADQRDRAAAAIARDAALAAITTDAPATEAPGPAAAANALRAALPDAPELSDAERALLGEWLDRLS
ncbi:TetR/AcrR family transcriptional regulator [Solirubrobacter phytolaccae]|uniref:TetR/AcrR family transcriptional regulator n=1 Tax=Solirubrobacter phytolaccae TaxID=1404360 RepID=A0A9X3N593_9ACTN|nr:TetR/AcrR family transcriptional regulator [Solirubrobacter phytolaccae]MDA0178710.1 TetR/AcrR family transcriptional regulator [Solirubrobacter phytolaccae]